FTAEENTFLETYIDIPGGSLAECGWQRCGVARRPGTLGHSDGSIRNLKCGDAEAGDVRHISYGTASDLCMACWSNCGAMVYVVEAMDEEDLFVEGQLRKQQRGASFGCQGWV
ncbi:hypothetical protein GP486_008866, partial [Trichoglossum hirsutum]